MTERIPPYNGIYYLPCRPLSTGPVPCPYEAGPATAWGRILPFRRTTLRKVISGGQTGVDRGTLDAAIEVSFPCGGWCPKGRRAEDGEIPERYPVTELASRTYLARTKRNVLDADATLIIFFGDLAGGTGKTFRICEASGKPVLTIDGTAKSVDEAAVEAAAFIRKHAITVLDVAGPRESSYAGAAQYSKQVVSAILKRVCGLAGRHEVTSSLSRP